MKNAGYRTTENNSCRHSAPMSFFGADFSASCSLVNLLNNTVLSVLFFLFWVIISACSSILLVISVLLAVIPLIIRKAQRKSYQYIA